MALDGGAVALTLVALASDLTAVLSPRLWLLLSLVMLNMALMVSVVLPELLSS